MKLNILEGMPVSLPAIQVMGLDLTSGAAVDVVVVVAIVVVVVVVVVLTDCPLMYFFKLNGFIPLCLAWPYPIRNFLNALAEKNGGIL